MVARTLSAAAFACLVAQACLVALPAFADDPKPAPTMREACKADFQKLCSDIQPGGGRGMQCLQAHSDQVSPDCKTAMAAAHDRMQNRQQKDQ